MNMNKKFTGEELIKSFDIWVSISIKEGYIYTDWHLERLIGMIAYLHITGIISYKERDFVENALKEIYYCKMRF